MTTIYEIWCNGQLHYTRPEGHPDIQEARELIERCNRLFGKSAYEVRAQPDDPLYQEAREVFTAIGYVTVSNLQRKMRIGYTRAAHLIDVMVADGFCEKEPDNMGRRKITNFQSGGQNGL